MKKSKLVLLLILLSTFLITCSFYDQNSVKVVRVVDGDTIIVKLSDKRERVRLIGVDTPETKHPRKPVQYFGEEAYRFTKKLCEGKNISLEYDHTNENIEHRDRYGRLLAYIFLKDGTFVNAEIVKQGYGHAYIRFPFEYTYEFMGYQREAQEKGLGMWQY